MSSAFGAPTVRNDFDPLSGGIVSVLIIDLILFSLALTLFVTIRRYALAHPPPCMLRNAKVSRFKRLMHVLFRRYNTHNRELEQPSALGWIWRTFAMSGDEVLARCGRDGFLYLQYGVQATSTIRRNM
jgi:hypothetical protein